MRPLPIRKRLTGWYSLMFASAALLLSLTSWSMLRAAIDASLQQDLQERVDDVREQLNQLGAGVDPQESQRRFETIYKYRDDGKWLQIRDDQGQFLYRSHRMIAAGRIPALPQSLPVAGSASTFRQGTHRVRTFSASIFLKNRRYSVETGVSMNKSDALLRRFEIGLLILTPGIVLAALVAGHLLSRKALAPVTQIANEARRITDRNLLVRLPIYETNDEIAHLSATLNDMLGRIDKGFRSVRDFTANASHELRTPLARIRAEAEIALLSTRSAEEYRDSLEHLQGTATDMGEMLESLLALARADAGYDPMRFSTVNLDDLIESSMQEWLPVANRLSIRLQSAVAHTDGICERPNLVLGDPMALKRLLRIWLDNACKFTPPGGAITIAAEPMAKAVALTVTDTGIGISLDQQQRVFERFYRVQRDTARLHPGAGLGLSLAAWIAEQHKATIVLDSDAGKGTRIGIQLALAFDTTPLHTRRAEILEAFQPATSEEK